VVVAALLGIALVEGVLLLLAIQALLLSSGSTQLR
jgi:hypothetical protein